MKQFLSIFIIFSSIHIFAKTKNQATAFQKVLAECYSEDFPSEKINTIPELYNLIDQKFSLESANLEERETLFSEAGISKKLKFENDKWRLSKILPDETLETVDTGSRQKKPTIESTLNQLLIHAKIQSDWVKTKEIRAGQRIVLISRSGREIKSLQLQKWGEKKSLDCSRKESTDICSCRLAK
ncbi:MAG: hypothetical protein H7328_06460 [Bdellovibrio sp.]|nr:hypothetical protein [Bdellovibrio sp.]